MTCCRREIITPNEVFQKDKMSLVASYKKDDAIAHFPKKIKPSPFSFLFASPASNCISQDGYLYLTVKKTDYTK